MVTKERFEEVMAQFSGLGPLLVLGDVGVDRYTRGQVQRISPEAPVPVVEVEERWDKLGLAANVLDNLCSLGVSATLCGVLGDDKTALMLEKLLEERGASCRGLVREGARQTTLKERVGTASQQVCRIDNEDTAPLGEETQGRLLGKIVDFGEGHQGLIVEDYGKGVLTESVLKGAIGAFREKGRRVYVDPSRQTPPEYYRGATLLKPNRAEASLMLKHLGYAYGEKNLRETAQILCDKLHVGSIVITLGREGMALYDEKEGFHLVPAQASEVFDVSGAGDTAMALLAACLEAGATLAEAVPMANWGATAVVGKYGTAVVGIDDIVEVYGRLADNH